MLILFLIKAAKKEFLYRQFFNSLFLSNKKQAQNTSSQEQSDCGGD
jgi:hypothetical protein